MHSYDVELTRSRAYWCARTTGSELVPLAITLGALGAFYKNERKVKSGIVPRLKGGKLPKVNKTKLNTYVYYALRFKPAKKLKLELNKALDKKYQ